MLAVKIINIHRINVKLREIKEPLFLSLLFSLSDKSAAIVNVNWLTLENRKFDRRSNSNEEDVKSLEHILSYMF